MGGNPVVYPTRNLRCSESCRAECEANRPARLEAIRISGDLFDSSIKLRFSNPKEVDYIAPATSHLAGLLVYVFLTGMSRLPAARWAPIQISIRRLSGQAARDGHANLIDGQSIQR